MFQYHASTLDLARLSEGRFTHQPISYASALYAAPKRSAGWAIAGWAALAKRTMDVAVAAVVLCVALPFMLAIALLIRLDSPGPALFRQRRIGRNGVPFELLKFRTMRYHADEDADLRQATRDDPRVTRVGGWLRRTSLDELPQFVNVLAGDMSVVGPRPHAPGTRAGHRRFEEVTQRYAARHVVRPGITGLAQVRGWRGETDTEEKLLRRLDCDLEYIATWSLLLDLAIICGTASSVLRRRNAY